MPSAWHCRLCCRHSKQRAVPFPICYLFVSVFGWLDRPPICGPMPLMQLLLTLHRAFWTRPVERSGSLPFVDLYQLLPPSEMAC